MDTLNGVSALGTEDRLQIHQLYADYAFAIDLGEIETWLNYFTEDGELGWAPNESGAPARPSMKGHDALRAMAQNVGSGPVKGYHWNTNISVTGTADGAAGRCFFMLVKEKAGTGEIGVVGYFQDELVKLDRGWVFRKRTMHSL